MEKSSKRGKIPQSDWPLIMTRYDAGETLASIARTYDCSPPAISYVVNRSRSRQSANQPPPVTASVTEPQLIKAAPTDGAIGNGDPPGPGNAPSAMPLPPARPTAPPTAPPDAMVLASGPAGLAETPARRDTGSFIAGPRRDVTRPRAGDGHVGSGHVGSGHAGNGASERNASFPGLPPRAAPAQQRAEHAVPLATPRAATGMATANGDQRRTLHLSLGQAPLGNGGDADPQPADRGGAAAQRPPTASERGYESPRGAGFTEPRPPAYPGPDRAIDGNGASRKDGGGAFIDSELRARVEGDITVFLAAFDAALVEDTQESRSTLREATDRLLRAGARTRIELERLEARIPLPPRDNGGRGVAAWRHR